MPAPSDPVLRWALRAPRALYRWRLGWLLGRRFLLLEHVGRNSGRRYETVLEVIDYQPSGPAAAVLSGWGRKSDWYRNVEAAGRARITVGRQTMEVRAAILGEREAATVLAGYERRNRLAKPIVRRVLSAMAGFNYDGTDAGRIALVRQLPVVRLVAAPAAGGSCS